MESSSADQDFGVPIFLRLVIAFLLGLFAGAYIWSLKIRIDPTSALHSLSAITQISATILSIFSAALLFLMELRPTDIRRIIPKGDFVASFSLFTLAIFHSLITILTIERDTYVDLGVIILPLFWTAAAIFMLTLFIWDLYSEIP